MAASRPELVQLGRSQPLDQLTDPIHRGLQVGFDLAQQPSGGGRVLVDEIAGQAGLEGEAGQGRAQFVVQVGAQPAALLLAHAEQPRSDRLELVGQVNGADHRGQLKRQLVEDLPITGG